MTGHGTTARNNVCSQSLDVRAHSRDIGRHGRDTARQRKILPQRYPLPTYQRTWYCTICGATVVLGFYDTGLRTTSSEILSGCPFQVPALRSHTGVIDAMTDEELREAANPPEGPPQEVGNLKCK